MERVNVRSRYDDLVESESDYDPKLSNSESDGRSGSEDRSVIGNSTENWRGGYLDESESESECDYDYVPRPSPAGLGYKQPEPEPLIPAVWAGGFTVCDRQYMRSELQGLNACLSSKACTAARLAVEQLPPSIQWKKLPRRCVWPNTFRQGLGPTAHDIAVFFFPSLTTAYGYDSLLYDLICHDWALRTPLNGSEAELLLFTSIQLPPPFRRFQGKLYLWGVVFRGTHLNNLLWI